MQLISEASAEKLRGGFYTPEPIADFILRWAFSGVSEPKVLEPSCGDGIFLDRMRQGGMRYASVKATELHPEEAEKARRVGLERCTVESRDFFEYCNSTTDRFDLVVGNPPFIRYQFFDKALRAEAEQIFARADLKYSKLTNAWVSFVLGSSLLLEERGKIGFVVPAEILQVSFAKTLRQFISRFYNKINIVSFRQLVFPDIQQEVVLLLCERDGSGTHRIDHIEVDDTDALDGLDVRQLQAPQKAIDFESNKWTFYFLEQEEIDFIERIKADPRFKPLADFARVEVGITTGANPFFTVPQSVVETYQLGDFARPMVGRSVQVASSVFTQADWAKNRDADARANLLVFPEKKHLQAHPGALAYIADGEARGIHEGYKCRIRDAWQTVPSLWVSDALFLRRNNLFPKFVVNEAAAYTTDTMHRVKIKPEVHLNALVASYYNSLSLAFTEICGRSHGGGVLELMPNEVGRVVIPYHSDNAALLGTVDAALRQGDPIGTLLAKTNPPILQARYGLSDTDVKLAHRIWTKLSNRRLQRGKKKPNS